MEHDEFKKRIDALGIANRQTAWPGCQPFIPAKIGEIKYPGSKMTSDYGGGIYTADDKYIGDCHEQWCDGPCECCERDCTVMIYGVEYAMKATAERRGY